MKLKVLASGSSGNCYILEHGKVALLLDCGVPIKEIKRGLNYDISKVVGVVVSHAHKDHSLSVKDFKKMGISVFTPYEMNFLDNSKIKRFCVRMGDFLIKPFPLPHNGTDNYGFLIKVGSGEQKILYLTDFEYCEYTFKNQRVNHILCECNYQQEYVNRDLPNYEHKIKGHCSLETCKGFIQANATDDLRNVLLLHMGSETCDPVECVTEVQKIAGKGVYVDFARKGEVYELGKGECPF